MTSATSLSVSQIHTAAGFFLEAVGGSSRISAEQFKALSEVVDTYIELGLPDEAARLIDSLSPGLRDCVEVLPLRLLVLAEMKDYVTASGVAKELCSHRPEDSALIESVAICLLRGDDLAGAIHWMAGHKQHFPRFMAWPLDEARTEPPDAAMAEGQ